jgi:tetratricopeptide (TPR) repeat protein
MLLKTLGGLELLETTFTRVKPLMLLAYLVLEGVKDRRYLADFFWPDASDSLNSLSRALSQLRKGAPEAIGSDETKVWATVDADVREFLKALDVRNHTTALELYQGPFLHGAYLNDWGMELEEWIYETRERVAARAQDAMIQLAEDHAAHGRFREAASLTERAYELTGAPTPEPESLIRYYALLVAGDSVLKDTVRQEAESYGIPLTLTKHDAKARFQSTFFGREVERQRLTALTAGEWAWLEGAAGMGKTTLLKNLSGTYLPAKSGLPYGTLEPLLGQTLSEGEERMLRHLSHQEGTWLIDGWEWCDAESQVLLRRLRDTRPNARVIIASRERAPFRVDTELELRPFRRDELLQDPTLWEETGGLPALVAAHTRGEPVAAALESKLVALSGSAKRVYLALSQLEKPDPALVRRALGLSAGDMAEALEALIHAALIEPSGEVRAPAAVREYLQDNPILESDIAICLARQLGGLAAYPFFEKARLLWDEDDAPAISAAYQLWAQELLRRGFPQRAVESLSDAPNTPEITLLKARAMERAGLFGEALRALGSLAETADVLALKGALLWRLGKPDAAKQTSEQALEGDIEARAEALSTLGHLARSMGDYTEAITFTKRSVALWQSLDQKERWADGLSNLAVALALAGEDAEETFAEALIVAEDYQLLKARILLNQGLMRERKGQLEFAKTSYEKAARLAETLGGNEISANAWNNLGVVFHKERSFDSAKEAYEKALERARLAGERRMLGMFMANYAELTENREAWQEALHILEESGHAEEAAQYRNDLPADHPFRRYNGNGFHQ